MIRAAGNPSLQGTYVPAGETESKHRISPLQNAGAQGLGTAEQGLCAKPCGDISSSEGVFTIYVSN